MAGVKMRLVVVGRVQGVGFRWFARERAAGAGLSGWVRNRADGAVEVEVLGEAEKVRSFIEALRVGPPWGRVDEIRETDLGAAEAGEGRFEIVG